MKKYKVTITETLRKTVYIQAGSRMEAENIAKAAWKNADYILDADHFHGVAFQAREQKELER